MTAVEATILTIWAIGFFGSFVWWFRLVKEVPHEERNDPFMVCLFWPLAIAFVVGLFLWCAATDMARTLWPKRKNA